MVTESNIEKLIVEILISSDKENTVTLLKMALYKRQSMVAIRPENNPAKTDFEKVVCSRS